jgi:hypothetical protein
LNWLSFNESFSLISACLTERALAVVEKWKKELKKNQEKPFVFIRKTCP